jgi:hypothetical protein
VGKKQSTHRIALEQLTAQPLHVSLPLVMGSVIDFAARTLPVTRAGSTAAFGTIGNSAYINISSNAG